MTLLRFIKYKLCIKHLKLWEKFFKNLKTQLISAIRCLQSNQRRKQHKQTERIYK